MASDRCDVCERELGEGWLSTDVVGHGTQSHIRESGEICPSCWAMLKRMQPSEGDGRLDDEIDAVAESEQLLSD